MGTCATCKYWQPIPETMNLAGICGSKSFSSNVVKIETRPLLGGVYETYLDFGCIRHEEKNK